jgi:hypothetical protein
MSSCHDDTKNVERLSVQLEIINPDLEIRLPGQLVVTNHSFILFDPYAHSEAVRVLDKQTGEKITGFIDIGQGPDEFVTPWCGFISNDTLTVFDLNIQKIFECNLDSLYKGNVTVKPIKFLHPEVTELSKLATNQYVATSLAQKPFSIIKNDEVVFEFGKYPFDVKITNYFDVFQGDVLYNSDRHVLGYATHLTPYLSLYKFEADTFRLLWESRFRSAHYSIINSELKYDNEQPAGIRGIAFTKDYIVCLVKEMRLKDSIGREKEQMAKSVFLYNYEGVLIKILELDIHTSGISAMPDSNVVYSVGLDEEYCLMKLDLGKYDL